jgi:cell division protein FtsB
MKILNYLFRPYFVIRQLQKENKDLKTSVIELKDENNDLWDMLEEIKQADQQGASYQALLNTKVIGEA